MNFPLLAMPQSARYDNVGQFLMASANSLVPARTTFEY